MNRGWSLSGRCVCALNTKSLLSLTNSLYEFAVPHFTEEARKKF